MADRMVDLKESRMVDWMADKMVDLKESRMVDWMADKMACCDCVAQESNEITKGRCR